MVGSPATVDAATASMAQGIPPNQKGVERYGKGDNLLHKLKSSPDIEVDLVATYYTLK